MEIAQKTFLLGVLSLLFVGCNQEFNTVGVDLIATDQFDIAKREFPVFVSIDSLTDVQSDQLSVVHFGSNNFNFIGRREANFTSQLSIFENQRFGIFAQETEEAGDSTNINVIDERERVTEVFLEIPFLNNQNDDDNDGVINAFDVDSSSTESDSDGDGVSDLLESQAGTNPLDQDSDGDGINDDVDTDNSGYDAANKVYEIDSIFGNRSATFNLKVTELDYFFNPLDPNNNFESPSTYFSGRDFYEEGFATRVLHDESIQLNFDELRFNFTEDDPETTDVDETTQVETRLSPRIRVPLETSFFQEKILDEEGNESLKNTNNFINHIKAINVRMENPSDDLYFLLNLTGARIVVSYDYDVYNDQDTPDDTSDDTTDVAQNTMSIGLSGVRINHFKNEVGESQSVAISPNEKFLVKGALGTRASLRLFDQDDSTQVLEDMRTENILINEASLSFYVDPSAVANWSENDRIAERLYLYKLADNSPLADYFSDPTSSSNALENKTIHSGILEYQDGVPYRYKFRVTQHITELIRSSSDDLVENEPLGLVVTSDINMLATRKGVLAGDTVEVDYPFGALINPLGTLLVGPNPSEELMDKRLKLEIIYTDLSN
ncbi:MAG: DUF4270 domain-containing protein [Flavobacteriaceae bacterium]|nr:DUF4270 domain-containing protein [Flavobacteriaceae bacterium]